jgi:hypothetical protein
MNRWRGHIFAYSTVLVVGILVGCKHHAPMPQPKSKPVPLITETVEPIPTPPQTPRPIVEGVAPLVYLVETTATVRVIDGTTNRELTRVDVPARTLVAVHERAGVRVGGATILMGPLPAGHRYAIFLESKEPNVIRQRTVRPGLPPPTTRHGGAP